MPSGWMGSWMDRTHDGLETYSGITYYILCLTATILGITAMFRIYRTRRELAANPSSRALIFSASSARIHSLTKGQFYVATVFLSHALAFYFIDTAISFSALWDDASANPTDYDRAMILDLAIYTVGMLAIFAAVFMLFPLLQILLCFKLFERMHRNRTDGSVTLAPYIPEARILTTHIGQLWATIAFVLMAYWPVYESATLRIILLEAVFGSGIMWLQLSYGFNFRVKQLEGIEVEQLLASGETVKKYGTQMFMRGNEVEGLPQYVSVAQAEQSFDEKAGA